MGEGQVAIQETTSLLPMQSKDNAKPRNSQPHGSYHTLTWQSQAHPVRSWCHFLPALPPSVFFLSGDHPVRIVWLNWKKSHREARSCVSGLLT